MKPPVTPGSLDDSARAPWSEASDDELLVAALADGEAFAEFYARHRVSVLAYFQRRTSSSHSAAELTAETFAAALGGLERFNRELGSGRAWLFGIATNTYRQWVRHGRVERSRVQRFGMSLPATNVDAAAEVDELVDFARQVPALRRAMAGLTDGVRAAIELRVIEQLPYADVARRLGCSQVNARVRVARGLARLAVLMEEA